MTMDQVRARLRQLAEYYGDDELNELADETCRRSPISRALPTSRRMTEGLAREIRAFVSDNPGLSQLAVGRRFGVNPGRVSESLAGFRE